MAPARHMAFITGVELTPPPPPVALKETAQAVIYSVRKV